MRASRHLRATTVAAATMLAGSPGLRAQTVAAIKGPALAAQGGWSVVVPSETEEMEWQVAYGAAFEYGFSHRFVLAAGVDHFGFDNLTGRFGITRLALQPTLFTGRRGNPRLFAGLRLGYGWKTSREAAVFLGPASADGPTMGVIAGSRSYLARTVAVEAAVAGDVAWFGDLVADGLAVYGTSSHATSLVFRVALVLSLGGDG